MELVLFKRAGAILKKKPAKLILIIALALIVLAGIVLVAANKTNLFGNKAETQQNTGVVDKGTIKKTIEGSGAIQSSTRKEISPKVTSTVEAVYFKAGDQVKAGDVMFELDDTDALLNIENIKNNIEQTQLTLDDNLKSINDLIVKAPFSGLITDVNVKEDDTVNNGAVLMTITDTSKLKLILSFGGSGISGIKTGMKALVNLQDIMQTVDGTITYISKKPYASQSGGQIYDIEITIDNPGSLKEGMTANAQITGGNSTIESIDSGMLEYINKKIIKSSSGGTVTALNIRKNEYVNTGDVLAELENETLKLNLNTVQLKLKNLQSQLEIQEKQLTYYKLAAPCSGTITTQDVSVGDTVSQGKVLAAVSNMDSLEFTVSIDELDISDIKVGQDVIITADAISDSAKNPFSGKVTEISMEGSSSNGVTTYPVTISLNKSDKLKTGMNVDGEIIVSKKENVLRVPVEALKTVGEYSFVYVLDTSGTANSNGTGNKPGNNKQSGSKAVPDGMTPPSGGMPPSGDAQPAEGSNSAGGSSSGGTSSNRRSSSSGNNNLRRQIRDSMGIGTNSANKTGNKSSTAKGSSYYSNAAMVRVEIGISDGTYTEILSGLSEGQTVILPQTSTSSGTNSSSIGGKVIEKVNMMPDAGGAMPGVGSGQFKRSDGPG